METQSQPSSGGFFSSTAGQMTLLGLAIVAILVVAWRYVW